VTPGRRSAPRLAITLLGATLSRAERDMIVGDLVEMYENRRDAGRRFNRVWFWAQALMFGAVAIADRPRGPRPERQLTTPLGRGFRHARGRLAAEWRYTAAVILIVGIGVGPAAAMLSVVGRVLLRPLDYRDPDRLAIIRLDIGQLSGHPGISPAEAIDLRASGLFEAVEIQTRLNEVSLGPPDSLVPLSQASVTTGMLPMLGVRPALGRGFTEEDVPVPAPRPAAGPPAPPRPVRVLLDHDTWQTRFGGSSDVLGRIYRINGGPAEVVGVLPHGFRLVTGRSVPQRIDVYMPFRLFDFRNAWQFPALARLAPGTTFEQVQAGLDAFSIGLKERHPAVYDGRLRFTVTPLLDDMTRGTAPALRAGLGGVLLLLLIALANATGLVVARVRERERDYAIRSALGATRGALACEAIAESVLLALGGALVGAMLALACVAGIREVIPRTVPRWDEIDAGWDLVLYAGLLALGGLAALGLVPIARSTGVVTWNTLRAGSVQGGGGDRAGSRLALVGAQIALTVVLAFGCAQLVRSAARLRQVDLGFDPHVLTVRVPYDGRVHDTRAKRAALYQRIRDRVAQVPGVTSVGITTHAALSGSTMMDGYTPHLAREASFEQTANYQAVTPGYFTTLRIPIRQGRDITDQEDARQLPVAVVDETLARSAFPGEPDVIGRTLRLGWGLENARIVGVVGHVRAIEVGRAVRPQIYVPIGNLFQQAAIVHVRTAGDPRAHAAAVVGAIEESGPGRAVSQVAMLSDNVEAATSALVAVTTLVGALAVSAGALSVIGLYLVVARVVHQRRRATAIRAALGASRRQITRHHFETGLRVMLVALPAGVLLALVAAPLLADLTYGVGQRDARSLTAALAVALVAGLLGSYVPVRRAADADIVHVLRGE
jgi:predicted permease